MGSEDLDQYAHSCSLIRTFMPQVDHKMILTISDAQADLSLHLFCLNVHLN